MSELFVTHYNNQNQINSHDATYAFTIIFGLLVILSLAFLQRSTRVLDSNNAFLTTETSNTLKGIAIILLIFGHLAFYCIEGGMFFEQAGSWAVVMFLFTTGIALSKTYGLYNLKRTFLLKRIKRLIVSTWIAVILFYILDYLLLNHTYSFKQVLFNLIGIFTPAPPNGAAWFITYILYLYVVFYFVSKIHVNNFSKFFIMLGICYISTIIIYNYDFLNKAFSIWIQYTVVFPISVFLGIYNQRIKNELAYFFKMIPKLYYLIMFLLMYQYFSKKGIYYLASIIDSKEYSQLVFTLQPLPFILSLLMLTYVLDKLTYSSRFLIFLGKHSLEIFLIHVPFMIYYDFFLFRKPLFIYLLVYLVFILILSYVLKLGVVKINNKIFINAKDEMSRLEANILNNKKRVN